MAIIALSDDARKNIKMGRKKKTSECPVLFGLPWAETAARKWINAGGLNKCCCFFPWKENVRGWAIQKKEKCVCHETRSGFPRWNATLSLLIGRGWRCFTPVTAAASSSNFRAGRTAILFWNGVVASHRLLVFWKEKKKDHASVAVGVVSWRHATHTLHYHRSRSSYNICSFANGVHWRQKAQGLRKKHFSRR